MLVCALIFTRIIHDNDLFLLKVAMEGKEEVGEEDMKVSSLELYTVFDVRMSPFHMV